MALFGVLAVLAITLPALNTLPPMTTIVEQPEVLGVSNFDQTISDPAFLPERAVQFVLTLLDTHTQLLLRLVSLAFGLAALGLMYLLLSQWHTRRIAALGTLLLATSSWFLHVARWAEPEVMYLAVLPALLLASAWLRSKQYDKLWPLSLLVLAIVLYVPGAWLFVVLFFILNFSQLRLTLRNLPIFYSLVSFLGFLLLLVPLAYSLTKHSARLTHWLGWPEGGVSLSAAWQNLSAIPKQLFLTGPNEPLRWLVGTPILDVATVVLAILGIYAYAVGLHPLRWRALAGLAGLAVSFIGLDGPVGLSLLLPLAYIFAANGLAYLLQQWFTVFPHNPVARTLGLVAILTVVGAACIYQIGRYYVAYPSAPATYQAIRENSQ